MPPIVSARLPIAAITSVILSATYQVAVWGQQTPYGPEIDRFNSLAYQAEQHGDFDTAIINYQRSLNAATDLTDPILHHCGIAGAESRLRGAEAAKAHIQQYGRSPSRLNEARSISRAVFDQYWDNFDKIRPELVNSCP